MIQKYVKGYVVYKEWKEIVHNQIIDSMAEHFRKIRIQLQTNSQIRIRYNWFKYKKEKQKKADEKKLKVNNASQKRRATH